MQDQSEQKIQYFSIPYKLQLNDIMNFSRGQDQMYNENLLEEVNDFYKKQFEDIKGKLQQYHLFQELKEIDTEKIKHNTCALIGKENTWNLSHIFMNNGYDSKNKSIKLKEFRYCQSSLLKQSHEQNSNISKFQLRIVKQIDTQHPNSSSKYGNFILCHFLCQGQLKSFVDENNTSQQQQQNNNSSNQNQDYSNNSNQAQFIQQPTEEINNDQQRLRDINNQNSMAINQQEQNQQTSQNEQINLNIINQNEMQLNIQSSSIGQAEGINVVPQQKIDQVEYNQQLPINQEIPQSNNSQNIHSNLSHRVSNRGDFNCKQEYDQQSEIQKDQYIKKLENKVQALEVQVKDLEYQLTVEKIQSAKQEKKIFLLSNPGYQPYKKLKKDDTKSIDID
ncbi:hypothetical protein TTHERM_00647020 (macronuclear) [Tetrahymena thermophila SB210]|uniref:Uncharacterized protein n=1 Tax=Tetrahymena thermophila (strain SB210) TaxID=312017 RepID=I7MMX6_TETTS|nr:hypothetical protein TTHERM_00647020 [Tetrahymena thermophila SB210]EAS07169.2 hypothetical protein TTHERM_00647020 [Tetrahymena thermophila SB210]|eukprot:XP_001027411.2 hypothetical protein TTHERM_00647020 [Tetrahymena thermophila SB210]